MPTLNHRLKPYLFGGVIVIAILLGAGIFRGCDNTPTHKEEAKEIKALQAQLKQTEEDARRDSIRLATHADSLRVANLDLQNKRDVISRELAATKQQVIQLAGANKQAKADNDTVRYIETCDSLREVAQVQAEVITMYQVNDSLRTVNYEAQLSAKDSLLANRAILISQLRTTNDKTYSSYQQLNADYGKVTRKLKREKTLSRILAIAAGVAGGAILLK